MSRVFRLICVVVIFCLLFAVAPAAGKPAAAASLPPNCQEINLTNPAEVYLICVPAAWNGQLVVFAHGYVFYNPLKPGPTLPYDQITTPDGTTTLPEMVNALGFAFAMTSYTKDGLAVQEGKQDTLRLVEYVKVLAQSKGATISKVYIVGASEGGLITTQLMEKNADIFSGGLAVCGPIGDFRKQINYWGDFRAVYDVLYPGVLAPSAVAIPDALMFDWASTPSPTQLLVAQKLAQDPNRALKLMAVTKAAFNPMDLSTVGQSTLGILSYNILATNEARLELGGIQPYDNMKTNYWDPAINAAVTRYAAVGDVAAKTAPYQTTGKLTKPLVTMHTLLDPIVPQWHQSLYLGNVLAGGSLSNYRALTTLKYGHCQFSTAQLLYAFGLMFYQANKQVTSLATAQTILGSDSALAEFQEMNDQNINITNFPVYLPAVGR